MVVGDLCIQPCGVALQGWEEEKQWVYLQPGKKVWVLPSASVQPCFFLCLPQGCSRRLPKACSLVPPFSTVCLLIWMCCHAAPKPWLGWEITEQLKGLFHLIWLISMWPFLFLGLGPGSPVPSQGTGPSSSPPALESWCC